MAGLPGLIRVSQHVRLEQCRPISTLLAATGGKQTAGKRLGLAGGMEARMPYCAEMATKKPSYVWEPFSGHLGLSWPLLGPSWATFAAKMPSNFASGHLHGLTKNPPGTKPTWNPSGTHVEPNRGPAGTQVEPSRNPPSTQLEPTRTHAGT